MKTRRLRGWLLSPVSILVSGNILTQASWLAGIVVITRLYDPNAFAAFIVVAAISNFIGAIAPLRFDVAIAVAETPDDAGTLWQIGFCATLFMVVFLLVLSFAFPSILGMIGAGPLGSLWPLPFIGGVATAIFQMSNNWFLRSDAYYEMTSARIARNFLFIIFAIALYGAGSEQGPIFCFIISTFITGLAAAALCMSKAPDFKRLSFSRLSSALSRYGEFPVKSAFPSALDLLGQLMPLLAIGQLYGPYEVGIFGLFRQSVVGPLSLISAAAGQVLMRQIATAPDLGELRLRVGRAAAILFFLSVPVALVLMFAGPSIFSSVYGDTWTAAGRIAVVLAVPACLQFMAASLSQSLLAMRKLNWIAGWQIAYFVAISGLVIAKPTDFNQFLTFYAAIESAMSLAYIGLTILAAIKYKRTVR